jgi:two-component system, NtrC family, nitrogen regulation sensor histidine kinase NtrY
MTQIGRPVTLDIREMRRRKRERIIILATLILIAIVTYLESRVFRGETIPLPVSSNALIFGLINIDIILVILLIFLIVRNLVKLIYERRHGVTGSKLRTRLVAAFVGLSLIPTVLLFLVSINFLSYSIDNWFSIRIGDALNRTLEVAQLYYQQTAEQAKFYARQLSSDVSRNGLYEESKFVYLKALVERRHKSYKLNTLEVHIENTREGVVVQDQEHPQMVPKPLSQKSLEELSVGKEIAIIEQIGGGDLVRGAVPVYSQAAPKTIVGFVMASYYYPSGLADKIAVISKTSEDYRQLTLLKSPIKFGYIITLFIVMLLIIFSATWFGLYLAKGITVPIQDLAEATRKIAEGDLTHQIEVVGDDEIGVLVDSFNQMTRDLRLSKLGLEQANLDLEQRRNYTETILRNVSAGVIAVDRRGIIATINRAAERMLGIQGHKVINRRIDEVLIPDHLALAEDVLREMRQRGEGFIEKQIDLTLQGRAMTFLMTITIIRDDEGSNMGIAVVFEDLTHMQRAERVAAWREVARRMAHEIKNPLTPVKLSAQRLQKKYGDRLGYDGDVFQECTKTIIDQVDILKNLVDEFSRYARLPVTSLAINDLNEAIHDSVILFQDAHKEITFDFKQGADIPKLMIDPDQIRRVMVNLLDNAVAAVDKKTGRIEIRTLFDGPGRKTVVEVADNGCGIPSNYKIKIFEPYFSTKRTGTGLGMAIVSSIIDDHHGRVSVMDNNPQGTVVAFELPVTNGGNS